MQILTGDFRQLSEDIADNSVDMVLTDPPYAEKFLPLWADLGRVAKRLLRPSHLLVAYTGQMYLPQVVQMLGEHLLWYWSIALLQPGANSRVKARAIFQTHKVLLVYQKPPFRRWGKWGPDTIKSPSPSKKYHPWGQSVEPARELIERFSKPGDLVLDLMTGGGAVGVACIQTGRRFTGFEIDGKMAQIARRRMATAQLPLPIPALAEQLAFSGT